MSDRNHVYVGLGSNIGDRRRTIERAIRMLDVLPGTRIEKVAPLYETSPIGGPRQRPFLNTVVQLATPLSPARLWGALRNVEKKLGRVRRVKWGPRTIDADILLYGRRVIRSSSLTIPHPRYHERRFVLMPLNQIAPHVVHPLLRCQNSSLLRRLTPHGQRVTIFARWKDTRYCRCKI